MQVKTRSTRNRLFIALLCTLSLSTTNLCAAEKLESQPFLQPSTQKIQPTIASIRVSGNQMVSTPAILGKIPFLVGRVFDRTQTKATIKNIFEMGYFTNVQILVEPRNEYEVEVEIALTEKNKISTITFTGNSALSESKLHEKLELSRIRTLDEIEIKNIEEQIKKLYKEKNYHHVTVTGSLETQEDGTKKANFLINEGIISRVRRVRFEGNKAISDEALQSRIYTKEAWLLGFLDRSGMYHPDAIMQDKYTIENIYQSNGFLTARVADTKIEEFDDGSVDVTFVIQEGEPYFVNNVTATENDLYSKNEIRAMIPIFAGQPYSKDQIRTTMEKLRTIFGESGYIYADVQPSIIPDESTHTVDIEFRSSLGNQITVDSINVVGNKKTQERVIRREILFDEGELLSKRLMDETKQRVQLLGYFDQKDGVIWRIIKNDDEHAQLDLVVKEVKTGHLGLDVGYGVGQGSDPSTPPGGFTIRGTISDSNFMGTGIRYGLSTSLASSAKTFDAMIGSNWLFDRPVSGSLAGFLRETTYENFKQTIREPEERVRGINVNTGMRIEALNFASLNTGLGVEAITYKHPNIARTIYKQNAEAQACIQAQVDRMFQPGDLFWFDLLLSQDRRDHPMFPTRGYSLNFNTRVGFPNSGSNFGFVKCGLDAHWYTTLIPEYALVLHLHGFTGVIGKLGANRTTPYRELFHVGGPGTVRGFSYGQAGPQLLGSSIGATRSLFVNAELQFPITRDENMRGFLFYDGGCGWHTPGIEKIPAGLVYNNSFDYRHSVGFGISIQQPTAIRIDWGFKLDTKKRRGEAPYEVHFGAARAF